MSKNLICRSTERQPEDTYTSTGGLIRLIARGHEFVGGVVLHHAWPWVYRREYLSAEDVD